MSQQINGFTLIELLIVIAIIGILAAVLWPSVMEARASAAERTVQAHSKNVHTAVLAWLASSESRQPTEALVASAFGTDCMNERSVTGADGALFGFAAASPNTTECTLSAADNPPAVTATVKSLRGHTYVNGRPQ